MRKICLLLLLLLPSLSIKAVEPWSGIGVAFFRCHYPIMTDESVNLEIYDSTLSRRILTINSTSCYLNEEIDFIEFADEVKGLCVISVHNHAIKVIITDDSDLVRYGWLRIDDKNMDYKLWSSLIPFQKNVFPLNDKNGISSIQFYKSPNGEILDIKVPQMKELLYDYGNEVVKILDCDLFPTGFLSMGTWMQVDVSYPHDEGQENFTCHRVRCWIRYLDDTGHPLVWYYTRD